MMRGWLPKLLFLTVVMFFFASLALIQVRYEARKLQARLNEAKELTQRLHEQTRRLQIERNTLTDYAKVHVEATNVFEMVFPDPGAGTLLTLPLDIASASTP